MAMNVPDWLTMAIQLHRSGEVGKAKTIYREILAVEPDNPDAMHLLALISKNEGEANSAFNLFRRSIVKRPDFAAVYENFGNFLRSLGRLDEAAQQYTTGRDVALRRQLRERLAAHRAGEKQHGHGSLILGLAIGYDHHTLAPFAESLAKSGYTGDTVLLVNDCTNETVSFLRDHNISVENVESYRHIPYHMSLSRYVLYYDFLKRIEHGRGHCDRYSHVMLTDTRDVVFQGDPFPEKFDHDMLFVLESRSGSLAQSQPNIEWIVEGFGVETLEELAECPISCSGTTFGTMHGTLEYLLLMQLIAAQIPRAARYRVGIDQGIHNVILHKNMLSSCGVLENASHVVTLGRGHQDVSIGRDGTFYNSKGTAINVVHQYDYHQQYREAVERRMTMLRSEPVWMIAPP